MAEKRSIPAALAICIGPATAYVSFLIFRSGFNEFAQIVCFAVFLIAGYDLAKSQVSLTGVLTLLMLPAIPVALYLAQAVMHPANHLSSKMIIVLWVASALVGAVFARTGQNQAGNLHNVKRLAIITSVLLAVVIGSYWVR